MTKVRAPSHLSPEGQRWFRRIADEYGIGSHDSAGLLLLTTALEQFDRMRAAQVVIAADGPTYKDRFGQPKPRPEVAIERDAHKAMLAALRSMNLDVEPLRPGPGRPPGR